ncbi:hypothetical protein [Limnoglobus roseus]|uniref:Uncharacterized protein n=1 Tax=Limnoglobus roseus TaxID=2598579 RepID=A0A5C1AVT4_9BACT|nr:hypothetical protein [Limnoglobus roseus]QEL20918.1 hypothetical protein PX52LOC_08041 [Limnoglobus roseus]
MTRVDLAALKLDQLFAKLAADNRPKDAAPDHAVKTNPVPFDPHLELEDKHEKLYQKDALFQHKIEEFKTGGAKTIVGEMVTALAARFKTFAAVPAADRPGKVAQFNADLDAIITAHGDRIQQGGEQIADEYLAQVKAGKVARRKYQNKAGKNILMVVGSVAGTGAAIAATVATFGAAAPSLVFSVYGNYKACKELMGTIHSYKKEMDKHLASAQKTLTAITEKYNGSAWKTAKGEVVAKAADEFLKTQTDSIKKLESDIKHFDRHIDLGYLTVHKMGKEVTESKQALTKAVAEWEVERKKIAAAAAALPGDLSQQQLAKHADLKAELDQKLEAQPTWLGQLNDMEGELKKHKETVKTLSEAAKALKEKRPAWVAQSGNAMRLTTVGLGAAAGSFEAAAAEGAAQTAKLAETFTSTVAEFATTFGKQITDKAKQVLKR